VSGPAAGAAGAGSGAAPAGVVDYFALEAADCLATIERWAAAAERDASVPVDDAGRAARALRGAATVARQPEFAAVAAAMERAIGAAGQPSGARPPRPRGAADHARLVDAVVGAVDAFRGGLRAARPLAEPDARALRAAADALVALEDGGAPPPRGPEDERVVPIRSLAADGDADFVVHRAPAPPVSADQRFRGASIPLAQAVRRLVADARSATSAGGESPDLTRTLGADLRAALADLRELAESYDVRPVAAFFAGREGAVAALDPRALAAVDAAASGLVAGQPTGPAAAPAPPTPAPAPTDADGGPTAAGPVPAAREPAAPAAREGAAPPAPAEREDGFRRAKGDALVALLETGISSFGHIDTLQAAPEPPHAAAAAATPSCRSRRSSTPAARRSTARAPCATSCARPPARPTPRCSTSCTTCSTSRPRADPPGAHRLEERARLRAERPAPLVDPARPAVRLGVGRRARGRLALLDRRHGDRDAHLPRARAAVAGHPRPGRRRRAVRPALARHRRGDDGEQRAPGPRRRARARLRARARGAARARRDGVRVDRRRPRVRPDRAAAPHARRAVRPGVPAGRHGVRARASPRSRAAASSR
jgi:hypothetical protein